MRHKNKSSFQNRTKTLRFLIFELLRFSHILLHLRPGHPAAGTSSKATITTITVTTMLATESTESQQHCQIGEF